MGKVYQITEYSSFVSEVGAKGYITLPKTTFDQLEAFLLSSSGRDEDALELMGISARRGVGKVITAKKYVGIIAMKDGTVIEILPKVHVPGAEDEGAAAARSKKLLLEMLKSLRNAPHKRMEMSSLDVERMNVLEVFIRMFIDEVFRITKRGLKCGYERVEGNERFFKGKMKFAQQIKFNHAHRERNYVEYDTFSLNRPENRILKTTLLYLYRQTTSSRNKTDLRLLLNAFSEVEASADPKADLARYVPDRNMQHYAAALMWSKIFLEGQSFTSFAGSQVAVALLFSMEQLFESYMAMWFRRLLPAAEYAVTAQDRTHHLFNQPRERFLLKPDIVVRRKQDGAVFILDTKWKVLTPKKPNCGISTPDMYQMYAYQKKYQAEQVTLLYPVTEMLPLETSYSFSAKDGVFVNTLFVDLLDVKESVARIAAQCGMLDTNRRRSAEGKRQMINSTLCYLERGDEYLMLHRVKKKNDMNHDKWLGVGGKFEDRESPEDCVLRETREETGLTLTDYRYRGLVTFVSDQWPTEYMHLFTATGWTGTPTVCDEGELAWIKKEKLLSLPMWEGDQIFLRLLEEDRPFFSLKLRYEGETLAQAVLDGTRIV